MNLMQALTQQVAARGRELAKAQKTIFQQRRVIAQQTMIIRELKVKQEETDRKHREMLAHRESALKLLEEVKRTIDSRVGPPHYVVEMPRFMGIITNVPLPDDGDKGGQ